MILAFETSTPCASLAIVQEGEQEPVWTSTFETDRAHNAAIFAPVEEALALHRDDLRGIAVGIGPGSYGGVRVAIAVANGLGLALGLPLRGVSSLLGYGGGTPCRVVGDARRKTFYLAAVGPGGVDGDPELLEEAELRARLESLDDGPVYSADRSVRECFEGIRAGRPSAEWIGRIAGRTDPGQWPAPARLEPHYLRPPYITTPKSG